MMTRKAACLSIFALTLISIRVAAQTRTVQPVLAFPEAGLDDPAAYQGYQTRFFRDTKGNVVQVYLDARRGRVVNLLADAVDESAGFTVRDGAGKPIRLEWGSPNAVISQNGSRRSIEYQLVANAPDVSIGWILLGSMRVERDLGYSGREMGAYDWPTFRLRDEEDVIANLERLDPAERMRQLGYLGTGFTADLRARLEPDIVTTGVRDRRGVMALQTSFDGKNTLELDISPDPRDASLMVSVPVVSMHALQNRPIRFTVKVTTDGPSLSPLARDQIFNPAFLRFLDAAKAAADRAQGSASRNAAAAATVARYRLLERDVRGTELLSSREKLMAGLPNYATYFGRDMMMTSLMMQPVWTDAMPEFVIASALRKLGPEGDVSHEEALGGQAIRENAAEYNAHMANYFALRQRSRSAADTALAHARTVLSDPQKVRENYHMRDDEFQLPVIVARYLNNTAVTAARKRAFLRDTSDGGSSRVTLLLKELSLVAALAAPYARNPVVGNLIASPRLDATHWRSISWRDSNAGYANGRFAMDINAIWAPYALQSIGQILSQLTALGFEVPELIDRAGGTGESVLKQYAGNSEALQRALDTWRGAVRHFVVTLSPQQIQTRVAARLQSLPAGERSYWQQVLASTGADNSPLTFIAISLDSAGNPIPVVNTDPATALLLRDTRDGSAEAIAGVQRDVRAIVRPYPVGLFIDRLGPVIANDAYASPSVWQAFRTDTYHSPRVVWGREVNLILLGLANQIQGASRAGGSADAAYVAELRSALSRVNAAVEASGLKHNELWSYEIVNGVLHPIRYGASTDVQLWNVTDLAVQFVLEGLGLR
jgi:hypothetical protein